MAYLPTREQWLAIGFLSIWGYVLLAGQGKPCTTFAHMWLGETITFATMGLALWIVIDMIAGWVITALQRARYQPRDER